MDIILQTLISGLSLGSIYGLIGLGFTIVFSSSNVLNMAQGDFFTWGALTYIVGLFFMPAYASIAVSLIVVIVLSVLMSQLAMRPLEKSSPMSQMMMTLAVVFILQGIGIFAFGKQSVTAPYFFEGAIQIGGSSILYQVILIIVVAVLISWGLNFFLKNTSFGRALQACSFNRTAAKLMGIRVERMDMISYAISGGIGAIAGIIVSSLILVNYQLGMFMVIKGLVAAIIGGISNTKGALIGGIILGLMESLSAGFVASEYKEVIALILLMCLLFVRPKGIIKE